MKFGKLLRVTAVDLPEMEEVLRCYKAAKKVLKTWTPMGDSESDSRKETAFVQTLSTHLQSFNTKWEEREQSFIDAFGAKQAEIATADTVEAKRAVHSMMLDMHGEALLMLHWSMLAYTGLIKIMKKYLKRTGKHLHAPDMQHLLCQPFCSTEIMSNVVMHIDSTLQQLSADLGVPVDALQGPAAAACMRNRHSGPGASRCTDSRHASPRAAVAAGPNDPGPSAPESSAARQANVASSGEEAKRAKVSSQAAPGAAGAVSGPGGSSPARGRLAGNARAHGSRRRRSLEAESLAVLASGHADSPCDRASQGHAQHVVGAATAQVSCASRSTQRPSKRGSVGQDRAVSDHARPCKRAAAGLGSGGADAAPECQGAADADHAAGSRGEHAVRERQQASGAAGCAAQHSNDDDMWDMTTGLHIYEDGKELPGMVKKTQVALNTWRHLTSNSSTPSTILRPEQVYAGDSSGFERAR